MKFFAALLTVFWPAFGQTASKPVADLLKTAEVSAGVVDSAGFLYVAGRTTSSAFPATPGAFQTKVLEAQCGGGYPFGSLPCGDAFAAKIDVDRQQIVWATLLSGASDDAAFAIQLDPDGNVYVAGTTWSSDFPVTANAVQHAYGGPAPDAFLFRNVVFQGGDLFISKLSPAGDRLLYSTYFGGASSESSPLLRVNSSGQIFVAGSTGGSVPVTPGAYQTAPAAAFSLSGFALELKADESALVYSSMLPGGVTGLDIDAAGDLYAAGSAAAGVTTTANAYQKSQGGMIDAFLIKLDPTGTSALYSTWFGGSGVDEASGVVVDGAGNAWLTGTTTSPELRNGSGDGESAFLVRFDPTGVDAPSMRFVESLFTPKLTREAASGLLWTGTAGIRSLPTSVDSVLNGGCDSKTSTYLAEVANDGTVPFTTYLPPGPMLATAGSTVYYSSGTAVSRLALHGVSPAQVFCAVNGATFVAYPGVAPGQALTLLGAGLGPDVAVGLKVGPDGRVTTQAGGTTVTVDGTPAPILYAQSKQVNIVAPFEIAGKATVRVEIHGPASTVTTDVPVVANNLGLFSLDSTGNGQAAVLNQDQSVNGPSNPAALGSIISLFVTGAGVMNPAQQDGEVTAGEPPKPAAPLRVFITGPREAEVLWVGAAPALVAGVVQINVRLPGTSDPTTPLSHMPIWVQVGDQLPAFLGATIAVK